jgi:hypothetical protein
MANWIEILNANKEEKDGHWLWTGNLNSYGYGVYGSGNNRYMVGKISLKVYHGIKISNIHIIACHRDQICDKKNCFHPEHIYPGTYSDNTRDAVNSGTHVSGFGEAKRNKTHCPKGHPYSGWNLMTRSNGGRRCRKCVYLQNKLQRRKKEGH